MPEAPNRAPPTDRTCERFAAPEIDRRGVESAALLEAADLRGARVLEIGCGDGRLIERYAAATRCAFGLDSALGSIARAVEGCPGSASERAAFVAAGAARLPFRDASFDVALLAWSL